MPLILSEKNHDFGQSYLWSVTEDTSFFHEALEDTAIDLSSIRSWHPRRQKEWLSGRFLISQYLPCDLGELEIDNYGKPFIKCSDYHFSISHTSGLVGLTFHSNVVGLDLQIRTDKIHRIAHKFCAQNDYDLLAEVYDQSDTELVVWSLKEAVFKAFGKGNLSYRNHILIRSVARRGKIVKIEVAIEKDEVTINYKGKIRMIGPYCMSQVHLS